MVNMSKTSSLKMDVLYLITFIVLLRLFYCYENLSRRPSTVLTQSSTYLNQTVNFAIDGDKRNVGRNCASTDIGHPSAWLQVDLGRSFSIKSIELYFKNEDYWNGARIRQFHLDVSEFSVKQTRTDQRTRCYTDTTRYPALPPQSFDIECNHTARFVIVETNYASTEDKSPQGAILEICEIEISGCEVGIYSDNCTVCNGWQTMDAVSGKCVFIGQQQDSNAENMFILYVVIAVLCLSFILNIIMLIWILRHITTGRRSATQEIKNNGSTQGINNSFYQELGRVSGPPQYDQLQISNPRFITR